MKPLVTIAMITHHEPVEVLEKNIGSILNQDYDNIKLVIIDDKSICIGVPEFLDYYSAIHDNITVFHTPYNVGYVKAKNLSILMSQGTDYIILFDADMWIKPQLVSLLVDNMDDDCAFTCSNYIKTEDSETIYLFSNSYQSLAYKNLLEDATEFYGDHGNTLFRYNDIIEFGLLEEDKNASDAIFFVKFALFLHNKYKYTKTVEIEDGDIIYVDNEQFTYGMSHDLNISKGSNLNKPWDFLEFYNENLEDFEKYKESL